MQLQNSIYKKSVGFRYTSTNYQKDIKGEKDPILIACKNNKISKTNLTKEAKNRHGKYTTPKKKTQITFTDWKD